MNTSTFDFGKKFEKIKKEDILSLGEDNLLMQLKKKKEMEEKRFEEEEDEDEEDEDESISDSISSVDYEGLYFLDFS